MSNFFGKRSSSESANFNLNHRPGHDVRQRPGPGELGLRGQPGQPEIMIMSLSHWHGRARVPVSHSGWHCPGQWSAGPGRATASDRDLSCPAAA